MGKVVVDLSIDSIEQRLGKGGEWLHDWIFCGKNDRSNIASHQRNRHKPAMPVNKYQEFIPHTILQDSVKRFWVLEKVYTAEDNIEEVIPDACIELIMNFGSAYVQIGGSILRELPKVCLIGLLNKPLILQANGVVKIIAVRFFAWGALPFLNNEMQRDSTMKIELDDTWRSVVSKIEAKVHANDYQKCC